MVAENKTAPHGKESTEAAGKKLHAVKSVGQSEQERKLHLAVGDSCHRAKIIKQYFEPWPDIVRRLFSEVRNSSSKDSSGWYCPASFRQDYRDSARFVSRSIVTLDYDNLNALDVEPLIRCYSKNECIIHSTFSDSIDPSVRKMRVLLPLSREVDAEEYRKIALTIIARFDPTFTKADVRASCNPVQFMWWPVKRPEMNWVFDTEGQAWTVH